MSKEIIIAQITFRDKMVNDLCNKMKSSLVSRTLLIIFFRFIFIPHTLKSRFKSWWSGPVRWCLSCVCCELVSKSPTLVSTSEHLSKGWQFGWQWFSPVVCVKNKSFSSLLKLIQSFNKIWFRDKNASSVLGYSVLVGSFQLRFELFETCWFWNENEWEMVYLVLQHQLDYAQ